tara:strand:+ start:3560 stop:3712 length:153 start_codon:yes stop_codon:yes gene_type:complete
MATKKLTPKEIFSKLEDLHEQEQDLLDQLKDQVCKCDDIDDDLDADFLED